MPDIELSESKKRNAVLPIFLTVFIDLIGFSILIPVFPLADQQHAVPGHTRRLVGP